MGGHEDRELVALAESATILAPLVGAQLDVVADAETVRVIDELGRTEDVALSPDGSRLALAGFSADAIVVMALAIDHGSGVVRLSAARTVRAPGLSRPHGVVFVDDHVLLVANREAEVVIVQFGAASGDGSAGATSTVVLDGCSVPPVRTPGSVVARWLTADLLEVFTCNNYAHDVTRHVLDRSADWAVVDGEVLLRAGLQIPDGLAIDRTGSWIAVSNHETHEVRVYRLDEQLGPESLPDGILTGTNYPHGLVFAADGRQLVVADAGLPYLVAHESTNGDWSGERPPARITRVMDDDTFHRGRYNPQEGGPKGVDLTDDGLLVVTSEFQPLAFFEFADVGIADVGAARHGSDASPVRASDPSASLRRSLAQLSALRSETAALQEQIVDRDGDIGRLRAEHGAELARQADDLGAEVRRERERAELVLASTSWRLTAPLRRAIDLMRRRRR
ncbi:MAG TPA: hypothetical protein VK853_07925 [Ilumatobacteraceae bacterium]|nr:hypothetical protein [Ilumatobacteraceae bacterium]